MKATEGSVPPNLQQQTRQKVAGFREDVVCIDRSIIVGAQQHAQPKDHVKLA